MRFPATSGSDARTLNLPFGLILALLVCVPLPWGSRPEAAQAVFGLACAALFALRLWQGGFSRSGQRRYPAAARWTLKVWGLWITWIGIQVLPIPAPVLASVAPTSHALHQAVAGIGSASALFTVSIDPGRTVNQLLLTISLFLLYWTVLDSVIGHRARQRMVLVAISLSGVFQALYGSIMTLSGLEYGFFSVNDAGLGVATGTFINRNHFAAYIALALSAGTALVLSELQPQPGGSWRQTLRSWLESAMSSRVQFRVLLALMVIALVLSRSRMGNTAFFTSLTVMGAIFILLRHRTLFWRSLLLFSSMLVVDLLIVSEHFGLQELSRRIQQTDLRSEQRFLVFRDLEPLTREFAATGSGLGTFESAYLPHHSPELIGHFDHAHNDHLEFIIEVGLPGYALLLLLAGLVGIHGLKTVWRRSDAVACAIGFAGPMALLCAGIHGLTDFNLRIPAVAATLIALMALTVSCASTSRQRSRGPQERRQLDVGDA